MPLGLIEVMMDAVHDEYLFASMYLSISLLPSLSTPLFSFFPLLSFSFFALFFIFFLSLLKIHKYILFWSV